MNPTENFHTVPAAAQNQSPVIVVLLWQPSEALWSATQLWENLKRLLRWESEWWEGTPVLLRMLAGPLYICRSASTKFLSPTLFSLNALASSSSAWFSFRKPAEVWIWFLLLKTVCRWTLCPVTPAHPRRWSPSLEVSSTGTGFIQSLGFSVFPATA